MLWALWRRRPTATAGQLDLPLVGFDEGDALDEIELKERYTKETDKLLKRGYDKVRLHLGVPHLGSCSL